MKITDYDYTYCTTIKTVSMGTEPPRYIGLAIGAKGGHHIVVKSTISRASEEEAFKAATSALFDRAMKEAKSDES